VTSSGFRKDEEVFSFHITFSRAFLQTCRDILAMLLVSTILCAMAWGFIRELPSFLDGLNIQNSANQQFGYGNYTVLDYRRDDFNDIYAEQRHSRIKQVLSVCCTYSFATTMTFYTFALAIRGRVPYLYYSVHFVIMAVPTFLPSVLFACGMDIGTGVLILVIALFAGISTSAMLYIFRGHWIDDKEILAVTAARNKVATERGDEVKMNAKHTRRQLMKLAAFVALPSHNYCVYSWNFCFV